MTKKDLINKLANERGCSKVEATEIVETLLDIMVEELTDGGEIKVSGFGVLSSKEYKAKTIHSGITGDIINVPKKYVVKFKSSKVLEKKVNRD